MYLVMLFGLFLGIIFFAFVFIASKKSGKYYLAPVITFLFSGMIVAYSLFLVGGFEGMGYLFLAVGFLVVSIVGTLLLPLLIPKVKSKSFNRKDKISLFLLPILFFATIGISIISEDGYWIIEQASATPVKTEGYRITTISEGSKAVTLQLGEKYLGKEIEVKKVSKRGATEIILKFVDGGDDDKVPYIKIGLYEINEPLKVQTTDGDIFESLGSPRE
ncbi:YesK family protein [Solibacillus sp. FSL K6-4121]|uniref:YesK family protein n=1 Tax=Solibacillus sp. FSL K6-4121 TaxID=2921505 RepID=UPI0030FB16E0